MPGRRLAMLSVAATLLAAAPVALAEESPQEVVSWIRAHEVPLTTVEAGHGFSDLQPLKAMVGGARVVALGEATHSTREFFQLKHRMLEFLVAEMGFTVFAMEADIAELQDVNEYVLHGRGDPRMAVGGLTYWVWNTEEVLALVEWMRAWNANPAHPRKVKFRGFDPVRPVRAAREALAYLQRVDPWAASSLGRALAPLRSVYDFRLQSFEQLESLRAPTRALVEALDARREALERRSSHATWSRMRRYAHAAAQSLDYLVAEDESKAYDVRDLAMAEHVQWLLAEEDPGAKVVLWAHNEHVAVDAARTWPVPFTSLGWHLRKALGDDLRVFGFAFHHGQIQAADFDDPWFRRRVFTFPPAPADTLDGVLEAAGAPIAALDLRALPTSGPVADWFQALPRTREADAMHAEAMSEQFIPQSIRERYDVLLFVSESTPTRVLPTADNNRLPMMTQPAAVNLDFEASASPGGGSWGELPPGWYVPYDQPVQGYSVRLSPVFPAQGRLSAVIDRAPGPHFGEGFGSLKQRVDAVPFRGKTLTLRASVRAEGRGDRDARLWLKVGAQYLERPITHSRWRVETLSIDIPPTARSIEFGMVLVGDGRAWLDDVSLTTP